ncbi:MAG: beta-lactamase family protein [Hyphomonadaceae bacterium]|nr:beta-lactamase family protein [Hyphomonadaceae bacterium]
MTSPTFQRQLAISVLTACALAAACASPTTSRSAPAQTVLMPAAAEGTYQTPSGVIWLVQDEAGLAAVIGREVYPLRQDGAAWRNSAGAEVSFERDERGTIIAASDDNGRYARLSAEVPARVRALLAPRPSGETWVYARPRAEAGIETAGLAHANIRPEAAADLIARLTRDQAYEGVHALLVYRHDRLVLEEYFYGYTADETHDLRSATKSFHGALAAIAVAQNLIRLDEPIWSSLAQHYGVTLTSGLETVALRDVLDMRTGLACDDFDETSPGRELEMMRDEDWVRFLLALPAAPVNANTGHYCSGAVIAVGRLIEIRSGQSLTNYAAQHLFARIGIDVARLQWDFSPTWKGDGHVAALQMRPRDMLRFGRLYLNGGIADGRRVIDSRWIDETFNATTAVGSWRRYSRFWWTFAVESEPGAAPIIVHAAMGNGGQRIYVVPSLDAVIVMTGGNYNDDDPTLNVLRALVGEMQRP